MKTCSTCKFYNSLDRRCQRRLVTAVVMTQTGQGHVVGGFPAMQPTGWCGEHESNPEALS